MCLVGANRCDAVNGYLVIYYALINWLIIIKVFWVSLYHSTLGEKLLAEQSGNAHPFILIILVADVVLKDRQTVLGGIQSDLGNPGIAWYRGVVLWF